MGGGRLKRCLRIIALSLLVGLLAAPYLLLLPPGPMTSSRPHPPLPPRSRTSSPPFDWHDAPTEPPPVARVLPGSRGVRGPRAAQYETQYHTQHRFPADYPYVVHGPLDHPGKSREVFRASEREGANQGEMALLGANLSQPTRRRGQLALTRYMRGTSASALLAEAAAQRAAAAADIAPAVVHVDTNRSVLVSALLPGSSLYAIAKRHGQLSEEQQRRIIEILRKLGTAAGVEHDDCSNARNFVADERGVLHVLDFEGARPIPRGVDPELNLLCICRMLWGGSSEQGSLLDAGVLRRKPELLVRAFHAFCRRVGITAERVPPGYNLRTRDMSQNARCLAGGGASVWRGPADS